MNSFLTLQNGYGLKLNWNFTKKFEFFQRKLNAFICIKRIKKNTTKSIKYLYLQMNYTFSKNCEKAFDGKGVDVCNILKLYGPFAKALGLPDLKCPMNEVSIYYSTDNKYCLYNKHFILVWIDVWNTYIRCYIVGIDLLMLMRSFNQFCLR